MTTPSAVSGKRRLSINIADDPAEFFGAGKRSFHSEKGSPMTKIKKNLAYQFKISLPEIVPEIWRRIQVPAGYSFWDLHVALQ
jgi:hypothetical protein